MKSHFSSFSSLVGVFVLFAFIAVSNSNGQSETVNVCHLTGSETNPSFELTPIPASSLNGHLQHGDIYPVPVGGCPDGGVGPTPVPGATPEPITILLFGTGLAAAGYAARRVRRKK